MDKEVLHILLGRFSPIHKGHQKLIDTMVHNFGENKCLILIGSSKTVDARTPYSYLIRKKMIHLLYPNIKIRGIADTKTNLETDHYKSNDKWLSKIDRLSKKLNSKLIFYSGSHKDVSYFTKKYKTVILFNRNKNRLKISGTKVRTAIQSDDKITLNKLLDARIMGIAIKEFEKFSKTAK